MLPFAILLGALISGMALTSAVKAADTPCLEYEPAIVTLTGTITRHMEYGPPNFGEDPEHDSKEVYWYLDLDAPICVNGKDEDLADMESESDIRRLQIVYHTYPWGRGWIGHRASITGTLFHAISGHHHTDVLIMATKTEKLPEPVHVRQGRRSR